MRWQASVTGRIHGWQMLAVPRVRYIQPLLSGPRLAASFASQPPRDAPITGGIARRSMAHPIPNEAATTLSHASARCHTAGLTPAIVPIASRHRNPSPGCGVRRPCTGLSTYGLARSADQGGTRMDPRCPRSGRAKRPGGPAPRPAGRHSGTCGLRCHSRVVYRHA